MVSNQRKSEGHWGITERREGDGGDYSNINASICRNYFKPTLLLVKENGVNISSLIRSTYKGVDIEQLFMNQPDLQKES